jgi:hypothetical protein
MNRRRWAPWKESADSTSHEHIEGLSSIVPTSCHWEGGIVQNSSGRIIFLNPPQQFRRVPRVDLGRAVVLPLVGHAREPSFEEQAGRAIDLRRGAQPAGSDPRGGLALHQGHDDLAPESRHTVTRADALVAEDLPLASGEPLPSLDDAGTNRHEEFLSLPWGGHDVSVWNSLFI